MRAAPRGQSLELHGVRGSTRGSPPRLSVASRQASVNGGVADLRPSTFSARSETQRGYEVLLSQGMFNAGSTCLADVIGERSALFITTPTVHRLYGPSLDRWITTNQFQAVVEVLSLTEANKTMKSALAVCAAAERHGLGRRDPIISFGGGICSDVVRVAASLVRRGTPYICLPTTLVAQADAGIGIKGAVNFGGRKSYLGCFAPPEAVLMDVGWLRTLPEAHVRAGTAEILKMALIRDHALFDSVTDNWDDLLTNRFADADGIGRGVLERSIELMLDELDGNWYEDRSLRRSVDFGHTFSGKLEEISGYRLSHGLAVAIDMAISATIAAELGVLDDVACEHILHAFDLIGLPTFAPSCSTREMMRAAQAAVQHRGGQLNLVVPIRIGEAAFLQSIGDLPTSTLDTAINRLRIRSERYADKKHSLGGQNGLTSREDMPAQHASVSPGRDGLATNRLHVQEAGAQLNGPCM